MTIDDDTRDAGLAGGASRILLFDEDRLFCEGLRRAARKAGMTVTACYNFSDFWQSLLSHRQDIVGVVLGHTLVQPLLRAPLLPRLGDTRVVVTGGRQLPEPGALPLRNATYVLKRAGIPAVLDAMGPRRIVMGTGLVKR